ncbi:GNAT family N-acetyltransferase [Guptibacillus algicola]|uniref:GNAT family N-acetyltransferase n=1 Tax=Guptibacillus algicola TaxID=225844 RepID=UPI001CD3EDCD|nr:GNAT family protein [Alkalihalobacillus algicola]MCA0987192.1 GNAT family N-acetyltransferase [Alkalihalobacillus algicola]
MTYQFVPMTLEYAREIDEWHYDGRFDDLFMTPYFTSYEKDGVFVGPGGCEGFVALSEDKIAGLFEFTIKGNAMEIGLALEPSLVGKGLAVDYVNEGIQFGLDYYDTHFDEVRLEVEKTNKPAIRVYEKAGFKRVNETDEEIKMIRELV